MTQTSPKKNKDYSANQAVSTNLDKSNRIQIDSPRNKNELAQWWGNKNLQFKTTLLAVLIGVVPLVTIGLIVSQVVSGPLKTNIENREKDQVEAILKEVQLLLTDKYKDIQVMANLDMFNNTKNMVTRQQKDALLNELIEAYKVYDSIAVFDNQGNVVAQSKGTKLNNHLNQTYIQDALKKNGPVITDPLISATDETFSIYVANVIKDSATGKPLGFIRARMPVKKLQEIIDSNKDQQQTYYLVNSTGEIFLSNQGVYEAQKDSAGKTVKKESEFEAIKITKVFPKIEISEEIKTILTKNIVEKKEQFLAYKKIGKNDLNKQYSAIVAVDESLLFASKNRVLQVVFLGTLLTGGIVFIIAVELSKRFTAPIIKAAKNIERISAGDLDVYMEIEGNDEIAVLGRDINTMIGQIRSLVKEQQTFALQSTLLKNVTIKLSEAFDAATIFEISVTEIRKDLDADRVIIYQFDENWQGTIVAESVDSKFPKALGATILDPCFADKYVEKYMEGRVNATPDIYKVGLTDCHLRQLEPFQVKASLVAPILIEGELIGLLIAHQCVSPREWETSEIEFFSQMATQIGPSLERTTLLENQKLDSHLAQALKEISFKIAECLNQETIFEVAINETRKIIKGDRVIIYDFDENYKGTIIAESVDSAYPKALGAEILDPCFADQYVEKYQQGRVQATNNIYTAGLTKCHLTQLEPFEVKANLVTPIIVEGELLGLFIVHQCSAPRKWLEAECNFVSQVATQIGPSLERINLLAKQKDSEIEQREARERMQQRALELLMQVDPVSQGDLTIRAVVTEDEIGTIADSYNATIESLRKIVTQVQIASLEVTRVTTDQESFIGNLATESIRQSEDIGQALDQIQSLAYSARMVLNNAEQAEEAVKQSNRSVEEGEIAMNRTVDGILAIRETVAETAKKVKRLGESTQKISKVVNLISSFADQTNLLALNASIEAAHAGEEGRGFAVVAEEVRSLARQSADATAEIEKVVAEIQEETNDVVKAMEAGTEQVVEGTRMVEETRASLSEITAASAQINELVTAIAAAAAEQSQTSEEITEKMADVASISNETSVAVTQVSESFQQLLQVAEELSLTVSKFKV